MPVEMIGWIAPRVSSEIIPASGPPFDAGVIAETARIHERAGFDRVLIGYFTDAPDGFLVGAAAAAVTERLGFLLAHRPGFVAPPLAARKLATLDQLTGGRLAVHIITGGSDADQAKDGDWTDAATRYRRSAEYIALLRRTWTAPAPFDHDGEFYKTRGTYSEIRCRRLPHIPIYGGGGSDAAIRALAPGLDVYMLWGEPLKDTAAFLDRVRAQRGGAPPPARQNVGSKRLLEAAAAADVHDTCLWTPLAAATGAQGNSTALVGSPETVAKAMLEYYRLGATSLLIRGYDPRPDAVQYGEELIPRLRELVAADDEAACAAAGAAAG